MNFNLLLLFVLLFINDSNERVGKRIWGGEHIEYKTVRFIVLVQSSNHLCTGVVIHDNFILTAAHCFASKKADESAIIYYGSGDTSVLLNPNYTEKVESINVYIPNRYMPKHIGTGLHADIALIELEDSIVDDSENVVATIALDTKWPVKSYKPQPRHCIGIGFGVNEQNDTLLHSSNFVALHSQGECDCVKTVNTVCVEKSSETSFCSGDSGGALVCNNKLVGIASFIYSVRLCKPPFLAAPKDINCGDKDTGSVMTFICPFLEWIGEIVDDPIIPDKPFTCGAQIIHGLLNNIIFVFTFLFSFVLFHIFF